MINNNVEVIKASGEKEDFNKEKLYRSFKRAGVNPKLAEELYREVVKKVRPGISTQDILGSIIRYLNKKHPTLAIRYNLKKAIMELGPTGFPFEKYIARVLEEYGFNTKTNQIIMGHCVKHEIDVIAENEKERIMVECKFHNSRGVRSDLKVSLYVQARFLDVRRNWDKNNKRKINFDQAWLVTNTHCTSEAVRYATCVGLNIISWRYPANKSLEYLIENKKLYPITVLPSLSKHIKKRLAGKEIMLAKDLLDYSVNDLFHQFGLKPSIAGRLRDEARGLSR